MAREVKFDILSARTYAKLTQAEMAKKLSITRGTYQKYESGERIFRIDKAWKFANICGIPFDDIIFFKPKYTSSV